MKSNLSPNKLNCSFCHRRYKQANYARRHEASCKARPAIMARRKAYLARLGLTKHYLSNLLPERVSYDE